MNINNDADKNQIEEKSQRDDRELVALLNEEGLLSDQVWVAIIMFKFYLFFVIMYIAPSWCLCSDL